MGCTFKSNDRKEFNDVLRHLESLRCAMETLCECFLMRAQDNDEDPLWRRFYRIQMSSYLCCKKNLEVSAPEGDMVHDLIRGVWEDDVKDYMENSKFGPFSNVDQWFKTIRIDFPVDPFDPECAFFRGSFGPEPLTLCQKDAQKEDPAEAVSK